MSFNKLEYDRCRRRNFTEEEKERARVASRKYYASDPEKQRDRVEEVRQRRTSIISVLKQEIGCMDCGYNSHAESLEFDHRPGTKKIFGLANAYKYSAKKVEEEIAKCDVVCANCHRIRTASRRIK